MEKIFPFLLLLGAGILLRRLSVFPADTDRSLNLYVIYIALPAMILVQVPQLDFSTRLLIPAAMAWLTVVVSGLLVLLLSRLLHWSREITGALLLMVPLGNTSFLGIPMVEQFYGSQAIRYAILYDQLGSFLALSSYGAVILAVYGNESGSPGKVLLRIVTFPPFIALTAALFLPLEPVLAPVLPVLHMSAASLVPVVLVAIGFQVKLLLPRAELVPFAMGLSLRLLIVPGLFLSACRLLGLHSEVVRVSLFETAMPPMVTAGALASLAGLKPGLTSAMVGFGILFSFFTLPLIYQWIQ